MSNQMLFYKEVTPVSPENHRDLCIEFSGDYGFAREVNSVPLTAVELFHAAKEYTIVFAGDGDTLMPMALLGIEAGRNLYVKDDGSWTADYVPAFVRRYPFVFSRSADGATFMLCVDETWTGCNREGRGQRLFDESGERTEYLNTMLNFLREYQEHFQRTRAYCARLVEFGLLESMQAEFDLASGEKRSLVGFQAINRERLKALSPDILAHAVRNDELELSYLHLFAMGNFNQMLARAKDAEDAHNGTSVTGEAGDTRK